MKCVSNEDRSILRGNRNVLVSQWWEIVPHLNSTSIYLVGSPTARRYRIVVGRGVLTATEQSSTRQKRTTTTLRHETRLQEHLLWSLNRDILVTSTFATGHSAADLKGFNKRKLQQMSNLHPTGNPHLLCLCFKPGVLPVSRKNKDCQSIHVWAIGTLTSITIKKASRV